MAKTLLCFLTFCSVLALIQSQDLAGLLGNGTDGNSTDPDLDFQNLLDTAIMLIRAAKRAPHNSGSNADINAKADGSPTEQEIERPRCPPRPMDCTELLLDCGYTVSGIYRIFPRSRVDSWGDGGFEVYCDMETEGGGWTLIQKRDNYGAAVDFFNKDWDNYKEGFGDLNYDFWLGNNKIFALTNQRRTTLRFDLFTFEGGHAFADYDDFYIDDEGQGFRLHIGDYRGNAGDSFTAHKGVRFTSKDKDNDNNPTKNCAILYHGGWWFNNCHTVNLHGLYLKGNHTSYADGVNWYAYKGFYYSLKRTEMKVRVADFAKAFNQQVANRILGGNPAGRKRKPKPNQKKKPGIK